MSKTVKLRKGPSESATLYSIGTIKKGNDGNRWQIIKTNTGTHRWSKIMRTHKQTVKNKITNNGYIENDISLTRLKQISKKYNVLTSGKSKTDIALLLFTIRGNALSTDDLQEIHKLLPSKQKEEARKMIVHQIETPINNYKGMWKPAFKPLHEMSRREMIINLRKFRDAWENNTGRNQDLSEEKLAGDISDKALRERLKYYYSKSAKHQAANWIRDESQ